MARKSSGKPINTTGIARNPANLENRGIGKGGRRGSGLGSKPSIRPIKTTAKSINFNARKK